MHALDLILPIACRVADGLAHSGREHGPERRGGQNQRPRRALFNDQDKQPAGDATDGDRDQCIDDSADRATRTFVVLTEGP